MGTAVSMKNPPGKMYVSVTGLVLTSIWQKPRFLYMSVRAFNEARTTEGNLSSNMITRDRMYHTITVWSSKEAMRRFYLGEAHREAMKSMSNLASYVKIFGFWYDGGNFPSNEECIKAWRTKGWVVHGQPMAHYGDSVDLPAV